MLPRFFISSPLLRHVCSARLFWCPDNQHDMAVFSVASLAFFNPNTIPRACPVLLEWHGYLRCSPFLFGFSSSISWPSRFPRRISPRSLRVLSYPRRQPPHCRTWCLSQPERQSSVQCRRAHTCQPIEWKLAERMGKGTRGLENPLGKVHGSLGRYFERRLVADRLAKWEEGGGTEVHREAGRVCIVNEMQILVDNGWMHV